MSGQARARVVFSRQEPVRSWSCRADKGIRLKAWDTFAEICGGAAATLAGLLFVAVSIRITFIARSQELRNRAAQTLSLFGIVLIVSVLIAIPGQPYRTLGAELVVLAVIAGTGLHILDRRAKGERSDQAIGPVLEAVTPITVTSLLLLAAGTVLVFGVHAGLYVLVGPVIVAIAGGVTSAWLLLTKITNRAAAAPPEVAQTCGYRMRKVPRIQPRPIPFAARQPACGPGSSGCAGES